MLHKEQYARVKQLASAPSTPEKIYTIKTGENAGMKRKVNAKPERVGLLPVSEKTIWTWVKQGNFRNLLKSVAMSLYGVCRKYKHGLIHKPPLQRWGFNHEQHPIKASFKSPQAR